MDLESRLGTRSGSSSVFSAWVAAVHRVADSVWRSLARW